MNIGMNVNLTEQNLKNDELDSLLDIINEAIVEDATFEKEALNLRSQRFHAVRSSHNSLLEVGMSFTLNRYH